MILSKSGETSESKRLLDYVRDNLGRDNSIWTMTFEKDSYLAKNSPNTLTIPLDHEGDDWNKVPNNSTTVYLIVLQALAMNVAKRKGVTYDDFILNHPGGAIGDAAKKQ
jgi:arabinose-5-phosphate isomerase